MVAPSGAVSPTEAMVVPSMTTVVAGITASPSKTRAFAIAVTMLPQLNFECTELILMEIEDIEGEMENIK
jgi:hypothetical protein